MAKSTLEDVGIVKVGNLVQSNSGRLKLPPGFDSKKYAASWKKQGASVQTGMEQQILPGGYAAPGWSVYKEKGRPFSRRLSDGVYILLFRPKALQEAVNAHLGNVSKKRVQKEHSGETVEGKSLEDVGVLTNEMLKKFAPGDFDEPLAIKFNKVGSLKTGKPLKTSA